MVCDLRSSVPKLRPSSCLAHRRQRANGDVLQADSLVVDSSQVSTSFDRACWAKRLSLACCLYSRQKTSGCLRAVVLTLPEVRSNSIKLKPRFAAFVHNGRYLLTRGAIACTHLFSTRSDTCSAWQPLLQSPIERPISRNRLNPSSTCSLGRSYQKDSNSVHWLSSELQKKRPQPFS